MMIGYGGQVGTIVCIGKALGEGNAKKAKKYVQLAVLMNIVVGVLVGVAVFTLKKQFAHLFTSNEEIINYSLDAFNYLAIFLFIQCV